MPVVLADRPGFANTDPRLLRAVPAEIEVVRDFSARGISVNEQAARRGIVRKLLSLPSPPWWRRYEWLPLGEAGFFVSSAVCAARALAARCSFDLIVAHSSPTASLVVGKHIACETGLPLVSILADPWTICDRRGPYRPPHTLIVQAKYERRVFEQSQKIVLYTEAARDGYRNRYPHIRDRFETIHNGFDEELTGHPYEGEPLPPKSLLFFGSFSAGVRPDPVLHLLAELRHRGPDFDDIRFVTTSPLPTASVRLAKRLHVTDRIICIGSKPFLESQAIINQALLLVAINISRQQIVAKTYDYLMARRPILCITSEHGELDAMLASTGAGRRFNPEAIAAMADYVIAVLERGSEPLRRNRAALERYSFRSTAHVLAEIFDQATKARNHSRL